MTLLRTLRIPFRVIWRLSAGIPWFSLAFAAALVASIATVAGVLYLLVLLVDTAHASDRIPVVADTEFDVRVDGQSRTIARVTDPTTGTVCYLYGSTGISCLAATAGHGDASRSGPRP